MVNPADTAYLISRHTSPVEGEAESVTSGEHTIKGIKFKIPIGGVAWTCRSLTEQVTAIHTAATSEKDYRLHVNPTTPWLPVFYSTIDDRNIFLKTGMVILTEGIFDRAAVKAALSEWSVWARLTKGVGIQLRRLLRRHAKLVYTAFDEDEPGQKATNRALVSLGYDVTTVALHYPRKDPAALLEHVGLLETRRILSRQMESVLCLP